MLRLWLGLPCRVLCFGVRRRSLGGLKGGRLFPLLACGEIYGEIMYIRPATTPLIKGAFPLNIYFSATFFHS